MTMRQSVSRRALGEPLPIEGERRLAEGEAVEMAGDRALQRLELTLSAGVDPNRQRVRRSVEGHPCLAGPGGAARVLGEGNGAVVGGDFDGQIMPPGLGEVLRAFSST